jgi:hypothetical protein
MFESSDPKAAGIAIVTDYDRNDTTVDTRQCVHCQGHWFVVRGSKRPHVWCHKCGGWTCSEAKCLTTCYPSEKRMDDIARHGHLIWPT